MRWRPSRFLAAAALAATALSGCAHGSAAPALPTAAVAPSFTAEQVERGRQAFGSICAECHSASEFRGRDFRFRWRRRTGWDFFREVTSTMPEDAPGSLTDEQYLAIIAFILRMNGHEPGDGELAASRESLGAFAMDGVPSR